MAIGSCWHRYTQVTIVGSLQRAGGSLYLGGTGVASGSWSWNVPQCAWLSARLVWKALQERMKGGRGEGLTGCSNADCRLIGPNRFSFYFVVAQVSSLWNSRLKTCCNCLTKHRYLSKGHKDSHASECQTKLEFFTWAERYEQQRLINKIEDADGWMDGQPDGQLQRTLPLPLAKSAAKLVFVFVFVLAVAHTFTRTHVVCRAKQTRILEVQ